LAKELPMTGEELFDNHWGHSGDMFQVAGVEVTDIADCGRAASEHSHESPHLWLMLRGQYRVKAPGASELVGAGALVYTPGGESHLDHIATPKGFGTLISLGETFVTRELRGYELPRRTMVMRHPRLAFTAKRIRSEARSPDPSSSLIVSGLVLELMGQFMRESGRGNSGTLSRRGQKLVAELHGSSGLTVASLAAELGVHPVHLARAFRKSLGLGPAEYIRAYRCARAAQRLRDSHDGLAEVALLCGFSDQSSFTRVFRQQVGMTPGAYRRAAQ
jgi:AraC family transcriptional regulator